MNRTGLFCAIATVGIGLSAVSVIVLADETRPYQANAEATASDGASVALRPGNMAPPARRQTETNRMGTSRSGSGGAAADAMIAADPGNPMEAQEAMQAQQDAGLYDPSNSNGPQVGTIAPDFELTPLKHYDYEIDIAESESGANGPAPVRLSAFRNNLPVVLIFGSYT